MRTPRALWGTGLGLLALSLLIALVLTGSIDTSRPGLAGVGLLSWLSTATLYVGSGLVVGGAVLHVLRAPEVRKRDEELPHGETDYWGG